MRIAIAIVVTLAVILAVYVTWSDQQSKVGRSSDDLISRIHSTEPGR